MELPYLYLWVISAKILFLSLTPLLSMPGKGCWREWFCHPGVQWPLEDKWSISLWEIWCFATGQQNAVLKWIVLWVANTVNAAASGPGTTPKLKGLSPLRLLQEMSSRSVNSNASLSLHFLKISGVFSPVLHYFIWGNCVPSDMKQTAKQSPHHSASSRSSVQLLKLIFPFSQCICQDPALEQKIKQRLRRTKADPNLWPKFNIKPNETLEVCKCSWNISTSCSPLLYLWFLYTSTLTVSNWKSNVKLP